MTSGGQVVRCKEAREGVSRGSVSRGRVSRGRVWRMREGVAYAGRGWRMGRVWRMREGLARGTGRGARVGDAARVVMRERASCGSGWAAGNTPTRGSASRVGARRAWADASQRGRVVRDGWTARCTPRGAAAGLSQQWHIHLRSRLRSACLLARARLRFSDERRMPPALPSQKRPAPASVRVRHVHGRLECRLANPETGSTF